MPRNLDVAALRSFLTVAEVGGVTRAAARLNLKLAMQHEPDNALLQARLAEVEQRLRAR